MIKPTNSELVNYVKDALKFPSLYGWGGLMRICTKEYIEALAKMYPQKYSADRMRLFKQVYNKSYVCDCVGLIKSFWFGGIGSPKYNGSRDLNTNGMLEISAEKGEIKSMPDIIGLGLYMPGHVGVYIGNSKVIECTLGIYGDGIVETDLCSRGWTKWFKIPYIEYESVTKCCKCCNCGKDGK